MSPSEPPIRISDASVSRYAFDTHCCAERPPPRSRSIAGRATLTIDPSIVATAEPRIAASSVSRCLRLIRSHRLDEAAVDHVVGACHVAQSSAQTGRGRLGSFDGGSCKSGAFCVAARRSGRAGRGAAGGVGDVLFRVGERRTRSSRFVAGEVAILDAAGNEIVRHGPSSFLGELNFSPVRRSS